MAEKDLVPMASRTREEQEKIAISGGIASGVTRRKQKDLRERFKIALQVLTAERKKNLKKAGKHDKAALIEEVGIEVFSLLEIATSESKRTGDKKNARAAWNDVLDRVEGKAVQRSVMDVTNTTEHKITDKEKVLINRQIENEAKKLNAKITGYGAKSIIIDDIHAKIVNHD